MTVVSVKTGADRDALRVGLSDGSLFSVRPCYLDADFALRIVPGCPLSETEAEALRLGNYRLRAEKAALRLIARSEQVTSSLLRKLEFRGYDRETCARVVERLSDLGLLDDRRFARRWLSSRLSSCCDAPKKLAAALVRRGVSVAVASAAVREAVTAEVELTLIRRCVARRYRNAAGPDGEELRMELRRCGFSGPAVRSYLEELS